MAAFSMIKIGRKFLNASCVLPKESLASTCQILPNKHESKAHYSVWTKSDAFTTRIANDVIIRNNSGFYNRLPAKRIWDSLTTVSNPGRKRGRGRQVIGVKMDLNRGQRLGEGKTRMVWPGLNSPVFRGQEKIRVQQLEPDPDREDKLLQARRRKKMFSAKIPTLQRGWSGRRLPGMSIGPPDPIDNYTFEGFDSRVLEVKKVANVTANLGKVLTTSAFVATGNGNGIAGFGMAKASNMRAALRIAKNRAAQQLLFIERFNDCTVYHSFHCEKDKTKIFVNKAPEGSGLRAHRCIVTLCQLIGIKDLTAKVEGSKSNVQNLTKAFFDGLRKQETHQELANRMRLNVVEVRNGIPKIAARPQNGPSITKEEKAPDVNLMFKNLYYNGKVPFRKSKPKPFFKRLYPYRKKKYFNYKIRNQPQSQRERIAYQLEPSKEEKKIRCLKLK